jgi:zinc and cadmium transporter
LKEKILNKILVILVAFSAGILLGASFLHLIPEAIVKMAFIEASILKIFLFLIFGFCGFFALEQLIRWHHHHTFYHPEIKPFSYLILISDGIHNFIDGLIIAASFTVDFQLGITTTLAVATHELPQEISDFGVLVYSGFKKTKALFLNYVSAITAICGGIIGYLLFTLVGKLIIFLLPLAAGGFIYIGTVDLIPEIMYKESLKESFMRFITFLLGIIIMLIIKLI